MSKKSEIKSSEQENTKDQKGVEVPKTDNDVMSVFNEEFSSASIPVYVNSLKKEVFFREVTVAEQKSISKTMIQNESRKDIVYDTQCAMINQLCRDSGFDIYDLTEFDRIRILLDVYSSNYIQNQVSYKCAECGQENIYVLNMDRISRKLNDFELGDVNFQVEDRNRIYNFTLNYPSVRSVSGFYRNYMKKYKNVSKKEQTILDNLGNIEYTNLFIKEIQLVNKKNPDVKKTADLRVLSYDQIEQLLAMFPQSVLFDDDNGVTKKITTEFIEKINSVFQYEKCQFCGHQTQQGLGSLIDFF